MARDTEANKLVIDEALERFELICTTGKDNRDNYKSDLNFVYTPGKQWDEKARAIRTSAQDLCLEFNQLKQFVAQVVNDQLQSRPGIRVHAAGGDASEDVAEIEQGMIRGIEYDSKADDVYKNAFKLAVAAGIGWCRVVSEYESNEGFNQKLVIKPIQDSNTVYASTDYQQPDGSDRPFLFVTSSYTKTEFQRKWPDADQISWENIPTYWQNGADDIVVVDYYRRVCTKRAMVLMSDGAKGWKDEMPEPPTGVIIQRERDAEVWTVEWFTIAGGQQVLEEYEWPGSVIPVVQCAGEDMILDGKRVYQGLTRHARDAQSTLNYGLSVQATQLALAPRAPWVIAEGQDDGYQNMWRDANTKNWSALVYKPVTIDGVLAPPPQRMQPAMVSDGWDRWCTTMIGMIKSTIGMYEQSLGQKGNETSGKAITAREKQGDTATFNYVNNWHMMIDLIGRICVEVMPHYYDTERIVATIGMDDVKKLVTINQVGAEPGPDGALRAIRTNDITKGRYAVTVEAGPSFATKRQETAEMLSQLVQAYPPLMEIAGDLVVKAQDIPDADVISKRLKLMLPPQIQQAEAAQAEGREPPDPQIMAQMQEKDAQLQQATQTMDAMHKEIQDLQSGAQAKMAAIQSDAQIKERQSQVDAELKDRQSQRDAELTMAQAQMSRQTELEKAAMERQTRIDLAIITRATDLELGAMQAQVDTQQIAADAEAEAKRAEQVESTAAEK